MGILGTATKFGGETVKKIFSGLFDGDKKRTVKKTTLPLVKAEDGEYGVLGAGIVQNNELLIQSIDIQKEQNVILDQILKTLVDIKKNGGGNTPDKGGGLLSILSSLTDLIPDNLMKKGGGLVTQGVKKTAELIPRALPYATAAAPFAAAGAVGAGAAGAAYFTKKSIDEYANIPNREDKNVLNASSTKPDGTPMTDAEMREQAFKQRGRAMGGRQIAAPTTSVSEFNQLDFVETKPEVTVSTDASKTHSAQIIDFKSREILFSVTDMLIRASEIKINGEASAGGGQILGATPSAPGAGATPQAPGGGATPGAVDKTGENGKLPDSMLASVGIGNHRAQPAAAEAFKAMREAAKKEKVDLGITDSYRTYAAQVDVKARKPNLAATPGKSNHGWGLAFDMNFGSNMNSPGFKWMQQHAAEYGFKGPLQKPFEPWHWEYKGGGSATPPDAQKTGPAGGEPSGAQAAPTDAATAINAAKPAPGQLQTGAGVSSVDRSAPTYTGGGRQNIPVAAAPMTSPGTTPSAEPSAGAIAGKSGLSLPSVPPVQGETQQELANRIKSVAPHLKNQQCVTLAKAAVGSTDSVTTWRKGASATENELPVGTPVATFMNRQGGASERYDAGGTGSPGTGTTHAATVAGYVKDKDGKITGMQVWEQYTGSGGPRLKTYPAGQGFGEHNASNYHAIEQEGKDGQRIALGGKNNKYQDYLEKQRAAAEPQVAKVEPEVQTPSQPAPDAEAEVQGPPAPPQVAEAEVQSPNQPAESLTPPPPASSQQTATASVPAASGGPSPKPAGGAGISKPSNMGAPSNELIRAYLTVAA
jgi:hypothetical protein